MSSLFESISSWLLTLANKLRRLSKLPTPAFLSRYKMVPQDDDGKKGGDDKKNGDRSKDGERTKDEPKFLDDLSGLGRSTTGTPDLLTSVQEAGSDEHLAQAGPENTVRLLAATDGHSFIAQPTSTPYQPETEVDQGWGASSLQDHDTTTEPSPMSGAIRNTRVDAASQTDQ